MNELETILYGLISLGNKYEQIHKSYFEKNFFKIVKGLFNTPPYKKDYSLLKAIKEGTQDLYISISDLYDLEDNKYLGLNLYIQGLIYVTGLLEDILVNLEKKGDGGSFSFKEYNEKLEIYLKTLKNFRISKELLMSEMKTIIQLMENSDFELMNKYLPNK